MEKTKQNISGPVKLSNFQFLQISCHTRNGKGNSIWGGRFACLCGSCPLPSRRVSLALPSRSVEFGFSFSWLEVDLSFFGRGRVGRNWSCLFGVGVVLSLFGGCPFVLQSEGVGPSFSGFGLSSRGVVVRLLEVVFGPSLSGCEFLPSLLGPSPSRWVVGLSFSWWGFGPSILG